MFHKESRGSLSTTHTTLTQEQYREQMRQRTDENIGLNTYGKQRELMSKSGRTQ